MEIELETLRQQSDRLESSLRREIYELRSNLTRLSDETAWKEETHQKELASLQTRLQSAEARNEDLSMLNQDSTRPLLRQIEVLQNQHMQSAKDWEQVERSMVTRMHDVEAERARAVESERSLKDRLMDLNARIAALEAQNIGERKEASRLNVDLEAARNRCVEMENQVNDLSARNELMKTSQAKHIEEMRRELNDGFKAQFAAETLKWEERLKAERKIHQEQLQRRTSLASTSKAVLQADVSNEDEAAAQSEANPLTMTPATTRFPPGTSSLVAIERMQTTIKQNEAQISSLQLQLKMATKTRDEMADELMNVTNQCEELKSQLSGAESVSNQLKELEDKYNTVLVILGEKTERVTELEADVSEAKEVFKAQLEELVKQLNKRNST